MQVLNQLREIFKKSSSQSEIKINADWARDLMIKQKGFLNNLNKIETLILGSSHGDYGFNPQYFQKYSYNLASASQDLYYSYSLYEKFYSKIPKLKNIILFYSVFSPGFELEKTSEYQRCILFKDFFDISFKTLRENIVSEEKAYKKIYKKIKRKLKIDENYRGYSQPEIFFEQEFTVERKTQVHLRENLRENNQLFYLKKLCESAINNSHEVVIVLSPAREDYKSCLPKSNELFNTLFELTNENNIKVFNFYDDENFINSDFGDFDHLKPFGAVKLTQKINELINFAGGEK
jgi:hypothetical protein